MSTCGDVGSDVHVLIKELAIKRVQHRWETYSIESQHLAEGTEVARLRRRFSFCFTAGTLLPHASPSLQTGGGACEHPTAPFARPGVGTSTSYRGGNRIRGAGRSERGRGRDWSRGRNGDGNGDVDGQGGGDGAGAGTGVEANEGAQDGNGDGAGTGTGTGTGMGTGVGTRKRTQDGNGDGNGDRSEDCSGDGNGDDDNGNKNRIGEGGREAKKRKKPQNSCRRRAGNGGDMGGKRTKCRKERVGSVAANPDNLGSNKEARGEHKVLTAQVRFVQVERVCPL